MSFKKLATLDADIVYALGGKDKKNKNKPNPKSVEGYYLGSRQVPSPKSKTGFAYIHYFQTPEGNHGVWGKTNLDRQLLSVTPGTLTRATHTGMKETKNGPMYVYSVEVDVEDMIDVAAIEAAAATAETEDSDESADEDYEEETDVEEDQEEPEEKLPARAASASKQSEVNAILKRRSATR